MSKKIFCLALTLVMCLTFFACTAKEPEDFDYPIEKSASESMRDFIMENGEHEGDWYSYQETRYNSDTSMDVTVAFQEEAPDEFLTVFTFGETEVILQLVDDNEATQVVLAQDGDYEMSGTITKGSFSLENSTIKSPSYSSNFVTSELKETFLELSGGILSVGLAELAFILDENDCSFSLADFGFDEFAL